MAVITLWYLTKILRNRLSPFTLSNAGFTSLWKTQRSITVGSHLENKDFFLKKLYVHHLLRKGIIVNDKTTWNELLCVSQSLIWQLLLRTSLSHMSLRSSSCVVRRAVEHWSWSCHGTQRPAPHPPCSTRWHRTGDWSGAVTPGTSRQGQETRCLTELLYLVGQHWM